MLKRYQVLLDEWMGDHLHKIAERYDISFSETIRWALCMHVMIAVHRAFPKVKIKNFDKKHLEIIDKRKKKTLDEVELHRFLSNLYYETRKTIEFWEGLAKRRKD